MDKVTNQLLRANSKKMSIELNDFKIRMLEQRRIKEKTYNNQMQIEKKTLQEKLAKMTRKVNCFKLNFEKFHTTDDQIITLEESVKWSSANNSVYEKSTTQHNPDFSVSTYYSATDSGTILRSTAPVL